MTKDAGDGGIKILAENRKARFNYHILDTFEAGMVLTGSEIKSIRNGEINLAESFVRPIEEEVFLLNCHIAPYRFMSNQTYDPTRRRKLLLHREEIEKLSGAVSRKGLTIMALKVYLKNGRAKIQIGIARGKDAPDKRRTVKDRESKRDMSRVMKNLK